MSFLLVHSLSVPLLSAFLVPSPPLGVSAQITESVLDLRLGFRLVAITLYRYWYCCRGAGPVAYLSMVLVLVVWCSSQFKSSANDTYSMFKFKFTFLYLYLPPQSYRHVHARHVAFTFLKFFPCLLFLLFLAFYHLTFTNTPSLSFTNRWNMIDDLQDSASFGSPGNLIGGGSGTGRSNIGNGNRRSGQIVKPNTSGATLTVTRAATLVLGLVGSGWQCCVFLYEMVHGFLACSMLPSFFACCFAFLLTEAGNVSSDTSYEL